jgi:ribosomal protein L40E
MKCPRCQHENPPQAKFCLECGARVALTCTKCRNELPADAKFCLECGEPVASRTAPEPRCTSPESYTPKHLVEKILTSKAALEGERKQVTVLFADLKGSMERADDGGGPPLRGHGEPGDGRTGISRVAGSARSWPMEALKRP